MKEKDPKETGLAEAKAEADFLDMDKDGNKKVPNYRKIGKYAIKMHEMLKRVPRLQRRISRRLRSTKKKRQTIWVQQTSHGLRTKI